MDPKEASIYAAVLISSIIIGIIVCFFIISIIRQQRRNLELHRMNILAELNTLEKERSRVAADLHDDLGPILSAVKFKINSIEVHDEEDRFQLTDASAQLDQLISRIREIAYNLMPSALLKKGLKTALQEFIRNFEDTQLKFNLDCTDLPNLREDMAIHSFRIIQEVVHNTVKHARARELKIKIVVDNGFLRIKCHDDGIGFNQEKIVNANSGIGLNSLKSRSSIMGGSMEIDTGINKGTYLLFTIPL